MRRINIAIDASVAERLAMEAKRQNKTLFAWANECLDVALRVSENGESLTHIPELLTVRKFQQEMNLTAAPTSLMENMVSKLYKGYREDLLTAWHNAGRELATYFRMYASELASAASIGRKVWGLKKLEVIGSGDKLELHSIGAGTSQEYSECWAASVSGFASRYGYAGVKAEVSPGFVRMLLERTPEPFPQQLPMHSLLQAQQ